MTAPALRLESFASRQPPARNLTEADLAKAWQDGRDHALQTATVTGLARLADEIRQLSDAMTRLDAERAHARAEVIAAVGPVLTALVDILGPVCLRERLIAEILSEVATLQQGGGPDQIALHCPPDLAPVLKDRLAQVACRATVIVDERLTEATVELRAASGHTRLEPDRMLSRVRAILDEFLSRE